MNRKSKIEPIKDPPNYGNLKTGFEDDSYLRDLRKNIKLWIFKSILGGFPQPNCLKFPMVEDYLLGNQHICKGGVPLGSTSGNRVPVFKYEFCSQHFKSNIDASLQETCTVTTPTPI